MEAYHPGTFACYIVHKSGEYCYINLPSSVLTGVVELEKEKMFFPQTRFGDALVTCKLRLF